MAVPSAPAPPADRRLGGLTPAQGAAWGTFLAAHAHLVPELTAELEAAHDMPLTTYDVLRQLALASEGQLRMAELATRVMLSRPGLTGVVKRLEAAGLIERRRCTDDGRGYFAAITETGLARLREAHPTHVAGIRARFAANYSDEELRTLAELLGRLLPSR